METAGCFLFFVFHSDGFHHPGRNACYNYVGRHVFGDHRPRRHNGVLPNGHPGKDGGVGADPHPFFQVDGGKMVVTAVSRVLAVVDGGKFHLRTDQAAIFDGDASLVLKMAGTVDKHIFAQGDVFPQSV